MWFIIRPAGQAPSRRQPLSSNVRPSRSLRWSRSGSSGPRPSLQCFWRFLACSAVRHELSASPWAACPLHAALAQLPASAAVAVPPSVSPTSPAQALRVGPHCKPQSPVPRSTSPWAVAALPLRCVRFFFHHAAGLTITGADSHRQASLAARRSRFMLRLAAKPASRRLPLSSNVRRRELQSCLTKAAAMWIWVIC